MHPFQNNQRPQGALIESLDKNKPKKTTKNLGTPIESLINPEGQLIETLEHQHKVLKH
jgi:hypothetical protein